MDVALEMIGAYLSAYLLAHRGPQWATVCREPIVRRWFVHDPEEYVFTVNHLPALYLFRAGSARAPEDIAADIHVRYSNVRLLWVLPQVSQEIQAKRTAIAPLIADDVDDALSAGQDASWVVPGDPDPNAATEGSVLIRHAGLKSVRLMSWSKGQITIPLNEAEGAARRDVFPALDLRLEIETTRLATLAASVSQGPSQLTLDIMRENHVFATHQALVSYAMLYVQDGAAAQVIGLAATKVTAFTTVGASSGLVADPGNSRLRIGAEGMFRVSGSFSVTGTPNRIAKLRVRKNDVDVLGIGARVTLAATPVTLAFTGLVSCDQNDRLEVYAEADVDATSLVVIDGTLTADRVA